MTSERPFVAYVTNPFTGEQVRAVVRAEAEAVADEDYADQFLAETSGQADRLLVAIGELVEAAIEEAVRRSARPGSQA